MNGQFDVPGTRPWQPHQKVLCNWYENTIAVTLLDNLTHYCTDTERSYQEDQRTEQPKDLNVFRCSRRQSLCCPWHVTLRWCQGDSIFPCQFAIGASYSKLKTSREVAHRERPARSSVQNHRTQSYPCSYTTLAAIPVTESPNDRFEDPLSVAVA